MDTIPSTPIQPTQPRPEADQPLAETNRSEIKKSSLGMIIMLVVLLMLAGLGYFFLMPKSSNPTPTSAPTPAVTPTKEEKDVEAVDVTDTTSTDLIDVEKDINNL